MAVAKEVLQFWVKLGILDVILPWMITFLVVYGLLERTQVLGKNKSNINAIIGFVSGMLVVGAINLVSLMHVFVQYFLFIFVGVVFALIILRVISSQEFEFGPKTITLILTLFFFAALLMFAPNLVQERLSPFIPALISLAVLVGILWFVLGKPIPSLTSKPSAGKNTSKKQSDQKHQEYELEFEGSEKDLGAEKKQL